MIARLLLLFAFGLAAQPDDYRGFQVIGRNLVDHNGEQVVLVGVNKMVIWTDIDGLPAFPEIARTGANAVRIVWLSSGTAQQLDTAITNSVAHQLIPVIDCHDTTGDWSKLTDCVDYWVRPDVLKVIQKHEDYLIINIANEADSGGLRQIEYQAGYELGVRRMRRAGIRVPLIIDAPSWGQQIDILQKNAPYLMSIDPLHNLMFSIHMYWPSSSYGPKVGDMVTKEILESVEMDLPLIVGEFAYEMAGCVGEIPYETIIEQAHLNQIGVFAWSWGPGNSDCSSLDMTEDGTYDTLHEWGLEVAVTHPYSIQNTAVRPESILTAAPKNIDMTVPEILTAPDLVITDISWTPDRPLMNAAVTLTATVTNQGSEPIDVPVFVTFTVRGDITFESETYTAPIAPGESVQIEGVWAEAVAGNFVVVAEVTANGEVEQDANNNMNATFGAVYLS